MKTAYLAIALAIVLLPGAAASRSSPTYMHPYTVTASATALDLANAMSSQAGLVASASFVTTPPGTPTGVSDDALASFPLSGPDYAILTDGDATLAPSPNTAGNDGANDGGGNIRGNSDYDVTILQIDVNVPGSDNCLGFNLRFLSDEYPEYVGSAFNDAFIAELDTSSWTTSGSAITAPDNFAFDAANNILSINSAGVGMSAANSAGTIYDGATSLLLASTPITAGPHTIYLSIFDQGDQYYDSAVFLDDLHTGDALPGQCQAGAVIDPDPPAPELSSIALGGAGLAVVSIAMIARRRFA